MSEAPPFAPLDGVRVIDCSHVIAGPYSTYLLALLGADVIKVEPPGTGDWTRNRGLDKALGARGMGLSFLTQNAQKRSVEIDLKSSAGRERVLALAADSQVFLENFRPGKAAKLGLGWDDLRAVNPAIVYCSVSGYGQTGAFADRGAYDHVVQAVSGMMSMVGSAETGPTKIGFPLIDYTAGLYAAFGMMAALREVARTGRGQRVDAAMMDAAVALMAPVYTAIQNAGWEPRPIGNDAWSRMPTSGVFDTGDGQLSIAANTERQFIGLCRGLGRADILDDPRWADPETRTDHVPALRAVVAAALATDSAAAWEARLSAEGVPCGKVRTPAEVMAEAHVADRELFTTIHNPALGRDIAYPTAGFRIGGKAVAPRTGAPHLGADNDALLKG